MSAKKIMFEMDVMKEIITAKSFIDANEKNDDSTTGYGHELERERGRIEGFQKALELFERYYGDGDK